MIRRIDFKFCESVIRQRIVPHVAARFFKSCCTTVDGQYDNIH